MEEIPILGKIRRTFREYVSNPTTEAHIYAIVLPNEILFDDLLKLVKRANEAGFVVTAVTAEQRELIDNKLHVILEIYARDDVP